MLGDGAVAQLPGRRAAPGLPAAARALQRLLDDHLAGGAPVRWDDEGVRACFRCPECAEQVRAHDDLLLVAGMRVSQRARLIDAGITTVHELAGARGPVPELSARAVTALTAQARLQVADRVDGKPPYEVVDPQPLMVLPDREQGRSVLRLRGRPAVDGRRPRVGPGIPVGRARPPADEFHPFWAHDRAERARRRSIDFLAMVRKRRKRYPDMHIYHYAAYEKTHAAAAGRPLRRRRGRGRRRCCATGCSSTCIPLVRKSIRVGTENYSIKSLEPLYMGNELRSGEVTTATDSITQYAPLLRAARRRAHRRGRDRAQGDRGLQPLRLPVDAAAARLAGGSRHRIRGTAARRRSRCTATRAGRGRGRRRPRRAQLLRFAGDGAERPHARADRGRDGRGRARVITSARTSRSGGRTSTGVNNPVDEWADNSDVFVADDADGRRRLAPAAARPANRSGACGCTGELANGALGGERVRALRAAGARGPDRRPGSPRRSAR